MLDVCKYAIFFKKLYYSNKILFLDWIFLWLKISSLTALGVGEGKSGASQEEASKHVITVQPIRGLLFPSRYHKGTQNALLYHSHPSWCVRSFVLWMWTALPTVHDSPHLHFFFRLQMVSYIWIESLFQSFGKIFPSAQDKDMIQIF